MKKLINICLFLSAGLGSLPVFAQNDADPMLASAGFATSPVPVGVSTSLAIKFMNFGYIDTLPAGSMRIIVNFGATSAYVPSSPNTSIISGAFATRFTWVYNAGTSVYTGTLNSNVAPGEGGFINFQVTGAQATSGAFAIIPISIEDINPSQYPFEDPSNNQLTAGIQVTPSTPLALALQNFTGTNDQCEARLAWTTAFEENHDRFEIEVSNDGKQYTKAGVVSSAGNKSVQQSYSYNYTMERNRDYFFRLKMVDSKGQSGYSSTMKLSCTGSGTITIGPNPVTGIARISGLQAEKSTISIQDMKGSTLKTITSGNHSVDVDFSSYPSGVYYLRISTRTGDVSTHKMVKQ